ncbi:MAG: sigma-70 family RNA polymerase sigma factor [Gemmatimonadetes bacterium]|nr:sigma-70 family RNA polymerase sigma factor [Gemmatimonadota bacterium]
MAEDGLVRRAQAGDRAAFDELYARHAGRVYALCLRMTADTAEAERLTQDAFVLAWRRLASFRGDSAFSSWLHRIAVNAVLEDGRRTRRRRARVDTVEDVACIERERDAPWIDERMDLERAIAGLPPGARAVLVLHDIEGYRHDEIAGLLGIATGTSKAQLHRARRLLRERLNR